MIQIGITTKVVYIVESRMLVSYVLLDLYYIQLMICLIHRGGMSTEFWKAYTKVTYCLANTYLPWFIHQSSLRGA